VLFRSSHIRQQKDIDKFDKARELEKKYGILKKHITDNLAAADEKRRKVATVCYLIDALKIRVGDEKDEDEADTVGATTLTKENVKLRPGNVVEFDFYGKDFVRLQREVELPGQVVKNIEEFISQAEGDSPIFNGVRSESVSAFLDEIVPGISAKVFRTFHSTKAVNDYLEKADVEKDSTESQKKHVAKLANLQAAMVCNHKRKIPKSWQASLERKRDRLKAHEAKAREALKKLEQKAGEAEQRYTAKLKAYEEKQNEKSKKSIKSLKAKHRQQMAKLKERIEKRRRSDKAYIEKARLQIKEQEATRDYNLGTSLKSYIDPRVYKRWADKVGCDWKSYYPTTLQKKFSWVEKS
jgi:DNA topoisomerase-1